MERAPCLALPQAQRHDPQRAGLETVVRRVFSGKGATTSAGPNWATTWKPALEQVIVFSKGDNLRSPSPAARRTRPSSATFSFYWKEPGMNSHGMYYSSYFIGATRPLAATFRTASHGCLRTFIADQPDLQHRDRDAGLHLRQRLPGKVAGYKVKHSGRNGLGPDLGPTGGLDPGRLRRSRPGGDMGAWRQPQLRSELVALPWGCSPRSLNTPDRACNGMPARRPGRQHAGNRAHFIPFGHANADGRYSLRPAGAASDPRQIVEHLGNSVAGGSRTGTRIQSCPTSAIRGLAAWSMVSASRRRHTVGLAREAPASPDGNPDARSG